MERGTAVRSPRCTVHGRQHITGIRPNTPGERRAKDPNVPKCEEQNKRIWLSVMRIEEARARGAEPSNAIARASATRTERLTSRL